MGREFLRTPGIKIIFFSCLLLFFFLVEVVKVNIVVFDLLTD